MFIIGNKVITEFDSMLNTAFDNVTEVGLNALSFLYFLSVKVISHKPSIYLYAFSRLCSICILEPVHEYID